MSLYSPDTYYGDHSHFPSTQGNRMVPSQHFQGQGVVSRNPSHYDSYHLGLHDALGARVQATNASIMPPSTISATQHNQGMSVTGPVHPYNLGLSGSSTNPYSHGTVPSTHGNFTSFAPSNSHPSNSHPSNFFPRNLSTTVPGATAAASNHRQHLSSPGYSPSGPTSLPESLNSPLYQDNTQRGPHFQAEDHTHDDMMLDVEKDSPPTSFSSHGPAVQQFPQPFPRKNFSQQLPGKQGGGVSGVGRGSVGHNRGHVLPAQLKPPSQPGSGMRQYYVGSNPISHTTTPYSGSRVDGNLHSATGPRGKFPHQETATPTPDCVHHGRGKTDSILKPSDTSLDGNQLEVGIDHDINTAADDVKNQVGGRKGSGQDEIAPFDPNLECPTCGKRFRIGQIQKFRHHAAECTHKK